MVIKVKYSIILCVYNGEKYVEKCLTSLLDQTYSNYEIILIDDGSKDHTSSLLNKYKDNKKITIISQKNQGLSVARNVGVKKSKGDYLLFVDIDDTVAPTFLETIEKEISKDLDLIKFNYAYTYDKKEKKPVVSHFQNKVVSGEEAFALLASEKEPFELATIYAYKRTFFQKNNFSFAQGMYHEDYGLIPYIILKSKKVKLLDDVLYYYYQTDNSITRNNDYKKTIKKAEDIFVHSKNNKQKVQKEELSEKSKKLYYSYMANAILLKYNSLFGKEKESYRKKIKKEKIVEDLLTDTKKRKLKKIIWKIKIR